MSRGFIDDTDPNCRRCGQYLPHPKRKDEFGNTNVAPKTPFMRMSGRGRTGIFILGQSPGYDEDKHGYQWMGVTGTDLKKEAADVGFGPFYDEFYIQNAFRCNPALEEGERNWDTEVQMCNKFLVEDLQSARPWLVFAVGKEAIQAALQNFGPVTVAQYQGLLIPYVEGGYWVLCSNHPSAILHTGGWSRSKYVWAFRRDLQRLRKLYENQIGSHPLPALEDVKASWDMDNWRVARDPDEAVWWIECLYKPLHNRFAYDYENYPLKPYSPDATAVCWSFAFRDGEGKLHAVAIPWYHARWTSQQRAMVLKAWKGVLENPDTEKIAHHAKHELQWDWFLGIATAGKLNCTQIRQHLLREPKRTVSLDFIVFWRYGCRYSAEVAPYKTDMRKCPERILYPYACADSRFTLRIFEDQEAECYDGFQSAEWLFMNATPMLARMERTGCPVDVPLAEEIGDNFERERDEALDILKNHEWTQAWIRAKGYPLNFESNAQVGELLFGMLRLPGGVYLKDQWATSQDILKPLADQYEWIRLWQSAGKLGRFKGTFVDGHIKDNLWGDGLLHCTFDLAVPETYRSSCYDPNLQNMVKRDPRGKKLRRAFVPLADGWEITEFDYDQHEVVTNAHYCKDPRLIDAILHDYDFHRDYAARLLKKTLNAVTSHERDLAGKNGFVFPIFYGAWPETIWKSLQRNGFNVSKSHVERTWVAFRTDFRTLINFQKELIDFYNKNGYVQTFIGFRRRAPLTTTEIINFPIQSTAFHYLLYALIMIERRLYEKGLQARLVKQVHDSGEVHYPVEERERVWETIGECCRSLPWPEAQNPPVMVSGKYGPNWYDLQNVPKGMM